jgi:hypothetical protein
MAAPSKPVSGQPIETAWGLAVHDAAVAILGVHVTGAGAAGGAGVHVPLDTIVEGSPTLADLAANEFIAPVAGVYVLDATINCSGVSNGTYRINVYRVTGAAFAGWATSAFAASAGAIRANLHATLSMAAGERMYVESTTNSGGTGNSVLAIEHGVWRLIGSGWAA